MGETTGIGWADATFNVAWGCTKVSPGCKRCYAETLSKRRGQDVWGPGKPRRMLSDAYWKEPLKWNRKAAKEGVFKRVFTSSMADVFEDHPDIDRERARLWPLIRMTPHLIWMVLTKRADRIVGNLPTDWGSGYPNVWLGVSVEDAARAWRIKHLRNIPARVRFISYEPALGPIHHQLAGIDWVIYGGESGPGFREADPAWPRAIRDRCRAEGIAFFHKQSPGLRPGTGVPLDGEIIQEVPRSGLEAVAEGDLFS